MTIALYDYYLAHLPICRTLDTTWTTAVAVGFYRGLDDPLHVRL